MEEDQSQPKDDKPQGTRSAHPLDQRIVQVARVVMATKQQVEQLNGAVTELTSQQQHLDGLATDLKRRLSEFHERLGAGGDGDGQSFASGADDGLGARNQKLEEDLAKALGGIESTAERVELASSKMDEQVFALKARVTGFADGVEQWFKPARNEIEASREFVERASEQIREKIEGFDKAAQNLQACVDHGVADLQRRHESRDTDLGALASKLDDCLGQLDQQQLGDRLHAVQTQIESAVTRSEQCVTPILSDLGARLDASETATDEIRETCRALQNQVGGAFGRLEDRIADIQKSIDTALGAKLDDRLDRLEGQVAQTLSTAGDGIREKLNPIIACLQEQTEGRQAVDAGVTGQLAGILEGLKTWGRRSEEDAVHRTELSAEQKELGAALGRLEEKIEATLDTSRTQADQNSEQVAGVARHLETISEQLDARVARSLSEIHAENHQSQKAAVAQRGELEGGQKELGMAMLRLQGKVTESLTALTEQQSTQSEQAGRLAGELGDLREQLTTLGDQLGVMTAEIDNRVTAQVIDGDQVTSQLGTRLGQMQEMLETTLNDPRSEDRAQLARVERYLTDLREHVVSLGDQLQGAAGQVQDQEQLRQHMSTLGDQLTAMTGEIKGRVTNATDGSSIDMSETHEQMANVERQMNVLGTNMAGLKSLLVDVPAQVDERVAEAISRSSRTPSREQEQLTGVERQLDDLREHIATLSGRVGSVGGQTPNTEPPTDAVTREYLSDVVGRLEQQVTTAIGEAAARESDGDLSHQLEGQLDGLQTQLGTLGERLGAMESSLTELDVATHAASSPDHGFQKTIEELPARFETATEQESPTVTDVPEALPITGDETLDVVDAAEPVVTTDFVTMAPVKDAAEPEEPIVFDEVDRSDDAALSEQSPLSEDTIGIDDAADDAVSDTEPVPSDEPDAPADSDVHTMPVNTVEAMPRDELVDTMISVINSGNAELIYKFIEEQYAASALAEGDVETRVEVFMDVHEATGEMRVVISDEGDEGEIVLVLQTRRSLDRQRFVISRDVEPPHKIVRVNIDQI